MINLFHFDLIINVRFSDYLFMSLNLPKLNLISRVQTRAIYYNNPIYVIFSWPFSIKKKIK